MPKVTRWFVKTSFIHLVFALILGMLQSLPQWKMGGWFPSYLHWLVFGWLTQLIFGIAIWMLPKFSNEKPRGYDWLNWMTYGSLNFGLGLRLVFEPWQLSSWATGRAWVLIIAAFLQWFACLIFVGQAWVRVRGR
ncbi:MAG: hypothetical protein DDG59_07720 [Anaerolineae bacterium]|jgi:hypothetical protein|nr:MAG: hypothetical protein DDG59_07720 [Anaerolineae bacterium]